MQPDEKCDQDLHSRLPIGQDEKILAVYRHHWFAYASIWAVVAFVILGIMAIAIFLISAESANASIAARRSLILGGAIVLSVVVVLFGLIPIWLKSQEQVVLTEEALLQILQPSLFANKISQLNLQHVADVSVRQDFFGTMLGFGKISVETPGEQDNYEFYTVPDPHTAAKQIIDAHENFQAALQGGRLPSTLGTAPLQSQTAPPIDPAQYQQFLAFQQAMAAQAAAQTAPSPAEQQPPSTPPAPMPAPATEETSVQTPPSTPQQ